MYTAELEQADETSRVGWHRRRASPVRNSFRPVRTIKWRELTGIQHFAEGAMCECYTAHLGGCKVVVKKPSPNSREVCLSVWCVGVHVFDSFFVGLAKQRRNVLPCYHCPILWRVWMFLSEAISTVVQWW